MRNLNEKLSNVNWSCISSCETLLQIERIQNPSLWRRYAIHKMEMQNPNEKNLWHGTSPTNVQNIVANGFNRSYCGQHGEYP